MTTVPGYQLRKAPPGYKSKNPANMWGELHGTYPTLTDAMTAAGHPDPADWHITVGVPDGLFIDWTLYFDTAADYEDTEYLTPRWVIEAPTVAADYIRLLNTTYPFPKLCEMLAAAGTAQAAERIYQMFSSSGIDRRSVKAATGIDRGEHWRYDAAANTFITT